MKPTNKENKVKIIKTDLSYYDLRKQEINEPTVVVMPPVSTLDARESVLNAGIAIGIEVGGEVKISTAFFPNGKKGFQVNDDMECKKYFNHKIVPDGTMCNMMMNIEKAVINFDEGGAE